MQNTKLIKKISTSLVSTGEIIDSLQSNSSTNAPSIRAVVENMTPPMNLLINGDFQINQRGQTSYVNNTATPTYTLDMWQLAYGTINVLDNGIKITPYATQAFLNQKISEDLTDKQVTLVLKETNGEMHILQGVASKTQALSSKSGNITLSIGYISETNLYKIGTTYDAETSIEYIDLCEGDIAYPHVKEDGAIALLRCLTWVQSLRQLSIRMVLGENNGQFYFRYPLKSKMRNEPSVIVTQSPYYYDAISSSGSSLTISDVSYSVIDKDKLRITFTSSSNSGKDIEIDNLSVIVTCEPL